MIQEYIYFLSIIQGYIYFLSMIQGYIYFLSMIQGYIYFLSKIHEDIYLYFLSEILGYIFFLKIIPPFFKNNCFPRSYICLRREMKNLSFDAPYFIPPLIIKNSKKYTTTLLRSFVET